MTTAEHRAAGHGLGTDRSARRASVGLVCLGLAALIVFTALIALGTWQVHRLSWKLALIARVDHRIHAPPSAPPGPREWRNISASADEYRHVEVSGIFLNDREVLVKAVTELGAGFWVVTPLRTAGDGIVLINRGFVPPERRDPATRAASEIAGRASVSGLLRMNEPKGGFLRRNDPAGNRWFSRDVGAIATVQRLHDVAPFFIDADGAPNRGGFPVGGLTVVSFPNNHLAYAFTWYALAAMLAGISVWFVRDELRRTSVRAPPRLGGTLGSPPD